mgnify:CR=1 FL=1
MLAGNGFVVAVPEVYHELEPLGTVLACMTRKGRTEAMPTSTPKPLRRMTVTPEPCLPTCKPCLTALARLGTLGICLGGHLAFRAAMQPEALAGLVYMPPISMSAAWAKAGTIAWTVSVNCAASS